MGKVKMEHVYLCRVPSNTHIAGSSKIHTHFILITKDNNHEFKGNNNNNNNNDY